jgi:hypothetical protein
MMKYFFIFLFLISNHLSAKTQSLEGVLPFVSLTKGVSPRFDINLFTSGTFNLTDKFYGQEHFPSRETQFYIQPSLIYKQSPNLNFIFLGYVYQRNNPFQLYEFVNENRLFQQILYGSDFTFGRITHRLRFEERFIEERASGRTQPMATRLRYQIGLFMPLQGRELTAGEFFLNAYNEFYFSTTGTRNAFYSDNWAYAGIGYQTADWGRVEVGPLSQVSVINTNKDLRYFTLLQFGWSYNL